MEVYLAAATAPITLTTSLENPRAPDEVVYPEPGVFSTVGMQTVFAKA